MRTNAATAYPPQLQVFAAVEAGETPQFGQEATVETLPVPRLSVQLQVQELQGAAGAISLGIESANQAITAQQWKAEIAEFPIFFPHIAFDLIVKIKQFQGTPSLDNRVIEWRQDSESGPG